MSTQVGLTARGGPQDGQFFPFQTDETHIGRSEECSILINWDSNVSRRHARIYQQSGLYWLQDLGSTNGTFLTPQGGEERRLQQNESALLLDGGLISLGKNVKFSVSGLIGNQDEAIQMVITRLHQVLTNLYTGLMHLQPEDRNIQMEWLRNFEGRLRSAQNEQEILLIASDGTQTLFGPVQSGVLPDENLPPIPEDIPDPELANQVKSILNFFFSDIRNRFPKEDDQDG